jgi:hypothetical protein
MAARSDFGRYLSLEKKPSGANRAAFCLVEALFP